MPTEGENRTSITPELVDRGARLFDYLEKVQSLRVSRIQDIAAYQREGTVIWIGDLPEHSAVHYQRADPGSPFLMVQKVPIPAPPEPDAELRPWLDSGWDKPDRDAALRTSRTTSADVTLRLDDHPEVSAAFERWFPSRAEWAERALPHLEAHRLYQTMYEMYTRSESASETLEAVLALGFLTWKAPELGTVRRHVLTMPVTIGFDSDYGGISVAIDTAATGYTAELQEIIDQAHMSAAGDLRRAETEARDGDIDPFDRENVGALVRMFINCINPDAQYADEMRPGTASARPTAHYAPAVVLRRRGNRGIVTALRTIAAAIRRTGDLPEGVRDLVDPDLTPKLAPPEETGAIVRDRGESFLPLPLNADQLRILDHVDRNAHTLVQGPPGTGKTHTTAALITHLLAQGKRVLVTAHTDRALHEVRGKLPEEIKDLCVAVVGDSRQELEELRASISRISSEAAGFDPARSTAEVTEAERHIEKLRGQRAELHEELLRLRRRDVGVHAAFGYQGTLVEIATRWRAEQTDHGWITDLVNPEPDADCPVSAALITEWRALLLEGDLDQPEVAAPDILRADELPEPDSFGRLCAAEHAAGRRRADYSRFDGDPAATRMTGLPADLRAQLGNMLRDIDDRARELRRRPEQWVVASLADVHSGHALEWRTRAATTAELIARAEDAVAALGYVDVRVDADDAAPIVALAENLRAHIEANGPIKIRADGTPKIGLTTPRVVKDAVPLFERVRVDGRVPTTAEQLGYILHADRGQRLLGQLDAAWPPGLFTTPDGGARERLARHRVAHEVLEHVLDYAGRVESASARLREAGLPVPNWGDTLGVTAALEAFDAAEAELAWRAASAPLSELLTGLEIPHRDRRATATVHDIYAAVRDRDVAAYGRAHERLALLHRLRRAAARRDELTAAMAALPELRDAIAAQPGNEEWDGRLRRIDAAWNWAGAGRWLSGHTVGGVNDLCRRLDDVEDALRRQATVLAATRSWERAVGRLTNRAQSDLRQYAQLVRRLGKGTGQYADRKRADIQTALTACRASVPVWIMPIYRVVEQFSIAPDMFDVVVVDEASQAGLEAVFLQYLAPRIVVIGDDKQVSPSAVGVDASELERYAGQYLFGDTGLLAWKDPKRSLFDEADARYGSRITLVEHRRCVPEIIGFSNKIAYEPQGVPLKPVRRYGTDRLAPVRAIHVPDGAATNRNVNTAEADRIVDQIERCLADPRYAGKTFGVISLLGSAQAKHIRHALVSRIPPEELERRQLHCGDAADFQGAERDVIFLSLVAAPEADKRVPAQTTESTVQRYNVAVSRARDQLWLFHSFTADQVSNPEDLRLRLLEYCLEVERQILDEDDPPRPVPDDTAVEPFESLFEQRVYNRIVARGYRVTAHHTDTGYDIDLVVTGGGGQVAIECEDERWSGEEEFWAELGKQRDLQRCEWPLIRLRHLDFVLDPDRCLATVWDTLTANGIYPIAEEEQRRLAAMVTRDPSPVDPGDPVLMRRVTLVDVESDDVPIAEARLGVKDARVGADVVDTDSTAAEMSEWDAEMSEWDVDECRTVPSRGEPIAADESSEQPTAGEGPPDLSEPPAAAVRSDSGPDEASQVRPAGHDETEDNAVSAVDGTGEPIIVPYTAFSETLESPTTAGHRTIVADFVRIVAVEGPVTAARLRAAYVTAARTRERDIVRRKLDIALQAAVATGKLLVDDALVLKDPALLTYRLPAQHATPWRELGVRKIEQVPPRELAEIMANHAARQGWKDRASLFRSVINAIGQQRLTDNTIAALARVLPLAQRLAAGD